MNPSRRHLHTLQRIPRPPPTLPDSAALRPRSRSSPPSTDAGAHRRRSSELGRRAAHGCAAGAGMLPLVRAGLAPLHRLLSSSSSSPRAPSPRGPYANSAGGGNLPRMLLPLPARSSRSRAGDSGPAARATSGSRRGMSFCARAVDVGDEAPSSSTTAAGGGGGSDFSASYLSVRI